MSMRSTLAIVIGVGILLSAVALGLAVWTRPGRSTAAGAIDDKSTEDVVAFSTKGTGKPDTWSYLTGGRVVRMEYDKDGNGAIDRWEYFDSNGSVERVFQLDASGRRVQVVSPAK